MEVVFQPEGRRLDVAKGTSVMDAAAEVGITIERPCGRLGVCGKCRVRFTAGVPAATHADRQWLSAREVDDGWRLGCRHAIEEPATITVPDSSRGGIQKILERGQGRDVELQPFVRKVAVAVPPASLHDERGDWERLAAALAEAGLDGAAPGLGLLRDAAPLLRGGGGTLTALVAGDALLALDAEDTREHLYGAAVDIGSTTVVVYLLDLNTGRELSIAAGVNPQVAYGDDLIARVCHAGSPDGRRQLQKAIVGGLNDLLRDACRKAGVRRSEISALVAVGNPAMTQLFLGLDVVGLGQMPYVPVVQSGVEASAAEVGLRLRPEARVAVLPSVGGFVGADALAVTLTHLADDADGAARLAIDIGTNGEMVLRRGDRLWACSAAAGPAFEGARIRCGMRAAPGAIADVRITADGVEWATVEDEAPRGLCGSGLIDAVAQLRLAGVMDETGRLLPPDQESSLPPALAERLVGEGNDRAFILATAEEADGDEPVVLGQRDLREFQVGKASLFAAASTLLKVAGVTPEEVDRVYLAGAFGNFLNIDSALTSGLLPPVDRERIEAVGNAAGSGARLCLLSRAEWARAAELAARVEHLTLSTHPDYQMAFIEAMVF